MALAALLESDGFLAFESEAALRALVETGAEGLEAARCSFWRRSSNPTMLRCQYLYDEESGGHCQGPAMLESDDPELFEHLDRAAPQIFLADDESLPPALTGFMASHRFSALLQWPVVVDGRLEAILVFADRRTGRQWSEDDRGFARLLAGLAVMLLKGEALRSPALPICAPLPVSAMPAEPAEVKLPRGNQTILLVDADTAAHELLGEALNRDSYRLIHAFDQQQGFSLAADIMPDVVVLNVLSPGLDGWGLLAQLKNHETLRHIPVVLLTLCGEEESVGILRASDFITKPFRFELLLESINRYRPSAAQPRVLVVEDEDVTRSVITRLLERDGWDVAAAPNGFDALRRLESFKPAVVLLDLMMPGLDGFEFIRLLRMTEQPGRHLPLVVVTAKDLSDEEREWLLGTTRSFASKEAVSRAELVDTIRDWVGHATARRTVVF